MWPVRRVEQPESLDGAVSQELLRAVELLESTNVDIGQVDMLFALGHPMRQRHTRATGGLDADRIEARGHPHTRQVRRLPEDVAVVGSEALGSVEDQPQASLVQLGHTIEGWRQILRQMISVWIERDEGLIGRRWADGWPWVGDGLEQPNEQRTTRFRLQVRIAVGVAKDRPFGIEALDRFGNHVVVMRSM